MKVFVLIFLFAVACRCVQGSDNYISCEPKTHENYKVKGLNLSGASPVSPLYKKRIEFWMSKYGVSTEDRTSWKFIANVIFKSSYVFSNSIEPMATYEKDWGLNERNKYVQYFWITHTNMKLSFFRSSVEVIYSLYHGHTVLVHTIHLHTGKLETTALGFHSLKYTMVIKPEYWIALEFPQHSSEKHAVVGVTAIGVGGATYAVMSTVEEMIERYPRHEAVIRRVA